jgi:S1-C subfamily serine protease
MEVADLNSENARPFQIEEKKGVVVVDIEPQSQADTAGLIPGDVIIELNEQAVNNTVDYKNIIKSVKGDCLVKTLRGYSLIKE